MKSEELWIRDIQAQLNTNVKFKNWAREFGVSKDKKGIFRCGGRLDNAELTEMQKHPIMLDSKHQVTRLIVEQSHKRVSHNGIKETLTELRSSFWIVRGRQFVRKVLHGRRLCRRHEGKPFSAPDPPALPLFRTTINHPFTYTGIDFAGPLYVKDSGESGKVYIAIYTCGMSRAVHLDIVPDLTAETFLLSFRRFTARRGVPLEVKSDNGKTFKSAAKSLQALFDLPTVREHFEQQRIRWTFNLEKAPWWGGFFERLIKSVKRCLKKVLGNSRLIREELYTVLLEIEATLNSRPLTYVSTEDMEEPLTPAHLMTGTRLLSLPDQKEEPDLDKVDGHAQARRAAHLSLIKDHFWKRWKGEYLLELRNAHRLKAKLPSTEPIKLGDIVIIHDENKRRAFWNLGKVEQLITGKDHAVRGAVVRKITSKHGRPTMLRPPLQRLYPLEQARGQQQCVAGSSEQHSVASAVELPTSNVQVSRPKRAAAIEADKKLKLLT